MQYLQSLIPLAVLVAGAAGLWKVFEKAGKPGWAAIVPVYNAMILTEITGKPIWYAFVIYFCPCVGFFFAIPVCIELAARFGKSQGFGIGLLLLGFVFFPMLGFGSDRYSGSSSHGGH